MSIRTKEVRNSRSCLESSSDSSDDHHRRDSSPEEQLMDTPEDLFVTPEHLIDSDMPQKHPAGLNVSLEDLNNHPSAFNHLLSLFSLTYSSIA